MLKRIKLIFFGLLLSVFILEVIMQSASFLISRFNKNTPKLYFNTNEVRIICLGESTSDSRLEDSWPEALQKIFDKEVPEKSVKVINLGRSGISTYSILKSLERDLKRFKPHISISMIGINDENSYLEFSDRASSHLLYRMITKFRSLRLIHWVWESTKLKLKGRRSSQNHKNSFSMVDTLEDSYMKEVKNSQRDSAIRIARELVRSDPTRLRFRGYLIRELQKSGDKAEFEKVIHQSRRAFPELRYFNWLLDEMQSTPFKEIDIIQNFDRLPLIKRGNFLKFTHTVTTYRMIISKIIEYNAYPVVMQYPLRSIEGLEKVYPYGGDFLIISNKELFEKLLKNNNYDRLFSDNFAGDFGHFNEISKKAIARNVFKNLMNNEDTKRFFIQN
jgi:hypothetical protein